MTISITRKFFAYIIRSFAQFLGAVDVITGFRPVIYLLTAAYFSFFLFILRGNWKDLVNGIVISLNYSPIEEISFEKLYPLRIGDVSAPGISAISAGVFDKNSGKVLFSVRPDEKLAPASTTKLMTALVALDLYSLEEEVTVPYFCTSIDSTKAWLPAEEKFKAKDLLYTMLVGSAGDAACTLATAKVSYSDFVDLMNKKASLIGMADTNFVNPIGLDGFKGVHYSTVSDLYRLTLASLSNSVIADAVQTRKYRIKSLSSDYEYEVGNTNKFLFEIDGSIGVKTGTTVGAGEVLIYGWEDSGKEIIIIVMGSRDRFSDTKSLLTWTRENFAWKEK